jgi:hypothetical protein
MYKVFELEIIYEEYISLTKMSVNIYVISIGKSYIEFYSYQSQIKRQYQTGRLPEHTKELLNLYHLMCQYDKTSKRKATNQPSFFHVILYMFVIFALQNRTR